MKTEYRRWTPEEETLLCELVGKKLSAAEIARQMGRSRCAVFARLDKLGVKMGRNWTKAEDDYLEENWGKKSIGTIAQSLGRSRQGVIQRKDTLGLGAFLENGEYVTLNQLLAAVTGSAKSYSYKIESWVKNRGLPVHRKRVNACSFRVVYIEEFWKWAEKNRAFLDFSKMEPFVLGIEPDWVPAQRRKDFEAFALQRKDPWTPAEDNRLKHLLKQYKYGYAELSAMLRRSAGAIQRRCTDLGLKERPVKADNRNEWTDADFQAVADGIRAGDSYTVIGMVLGRSEKAVRGKVYYTYLTENADKIRAMIGSGPWGTGAPVPTVKQGRFLSRTRTQTEKDLSRLVMLLKMRRNALGWDEFFQKDMCMLWDDIEGCTANEENCDVCKSFQRIKPQYCRRCGVSVISRKKIDMCDRCKRIRKWQHRCKQTVLDTKYSKEDSQ